MSLMSVFDVGSPASAFAAVAAGAVVKYAAGFLIQNRKRKQYRKVGTIGEIWLFPVKSLRGIPVQEAQVEQLGLTCGGIGDRCWVVTKPNGKFMCMRRTPKMVLIRPEMCGDQIEFQAPGMKPIRFPIHPPMTSSNVKEIEVWDEKVKALDVGDEIGHWLSKYLGKEGLRLMFAEASLDKRDTFDVPKKWKTGAKKGDLYTYADACSYMVLSQSSVDFLNTKLKTPVPITNFRPNIIVHDCEAFDEDTWSSVRIGECQLRGLDPCTRCIMPTVNQETGTKSADGEPMETLKRIRMVEPYDKPIFGYNFAFDKGGSIKVGDPIYATLA